MLKVHFLVILFITYLFAGFPEVLQDINGNTINLKELTTQKTVAVITMKAPDCPVCQKQLLRIMRNFDQLSVCNVTFLVLAPGPIDKLQEAKELTKFPFPFIVDYDLQIARSFDLVINESQILPSIMILNDKLEVEWVQRGRNSLYFGDPDLMKRLKCEGWI
ncbi:MAG: redoxin domain-containing protein [Candidatus Marinimicrobia bacterium]|nr:redoxin domain-containing protein [Candidatus Neomarinimicrobiota bacterium]